MAPCCFRKCWLREWVHVSSLDPYREANRARWDETVAIHAASDFYGVDRFLAGESTLLPLDLKEVGDVSRQVAAALAVSLWPGHIVVGANGR